MPNAVFKTLAAKTMGDFAPRGGVDLWNLGDQDRRGSVEMSGLQCSMIVSYEVTANGEAAVIVEAIFPLCRVGRNDPRGYCKERCDGFLLGRGKDQSGVPSIDAMKVRCVTFDGSALWLEYVNVARDERWTRILFPSPTKPQICERLQCETVDEDAEERFFQNEVLVKEVKGVHGWFGVRRLRQRGRKHDGLSAPWDAVITAGLLMDLEFLQKFDLDEELKQRVVFVEDVDVHRAFFQCPERRISGMFRLAKVRMLESIFKCRLGLVHSPGGGMYYLGVWANDQAEYACPAFPFLTKSDSMLEPDEIFFKAALNSLRTLGSYLNDEEGTIPYSVEIEGDYIGRLDRGDAAMFAYGASEFLLRSGSRKSAKELFPIIKRCIEIVRSKVHPILGIVYSESDELEGRFPTGAMSRLTALFTSWRSHP